MTSRSPMDVVTGLRNTRRSMGDGTLGGRVRNATPYRRNAARRTPASRVIPPSEAMAVGTPATLTVEAEDVDVADDSDSPIPFGSVIRRQLVEYDPEDDDPDAIVWPWGGTVMFWLDGEWDDLAPGGAYAEVLIDGDLAWVAWIVATPTGVAVTLVAEDVDVADATSEVIEFAGVDGYGGVERQSGVNVDPPTDEVIWPVAGIVQFSAHGRWDGEFTGDVEYEVLVDGEPVWPEW